jgi:predicted nucleic acid-binding protein
MAKKYILQDIEQLKSRDVFLDANILIYLFWPTGQHHIEQNYARVLKNLLLQNNNLFVDILVISEVINRILRIEYQKINPTQNFKLFRNSQDGKDALNDIYIIVKNQILERFKIVGKSFNKKDVESFLSIENIDFIDKAIVSICKENSMILLTNDRDFNDVDLEILTCNPKLLD